MYTISKSFDACYGHRVYTQNVVEKYAGSSECPCTRNHGHQLNLIVTVESETLDDRGFVIDFKELGFIKQFVNDNIDHRFILSKEDPGWGNLVQICGPNEIEYLADSYPIRLLDDIEMGWRNPAIVNDSFIFVDFNPTSENLAKWIYKAVQIILQKSPFECSIKQVEWKETPKTSAIYRED